MNRAILQACLPCLTALVAACVLLWLTVRLSGARLRLATAWRRLRGLHSCEYGGVQSLAFVLTLPIFIVICMFIVQVSQLMIGVMVVNYAAHATARSAMVWAAARVDDLDENKMGEGMQDRVPVVLNADSPLVARNHKYQKVFQAAVLACAPASPSRDTGFPNSDTRAVADAMQRVYALMVPSSNSNSRVPVRLQNKLAYSYANTAVRIVFADKDSYPGPTYNPRLAVRDPGGGVVREWDRHEVGWQDPIRVTVTHEFALIPGPGRLLARHLVRSDNQPDPVASRIDRGTSPTGEPLYTTPITASATLTNEGFKSLVPYAQQSY